ncbi:hypothetical protein OC844_006844 [Tilletia horrida]|nr:hypothetical protein OC844_006844 [Tilletia horrida]
MRPPVEDSEDKDEAAATVLSPPAQPLPPAPPGAALATAAQANNTASATANGNALRNLSRPSDRSLAASAHAPRPGSTRPTPVTARAAGPTAAAAETLLRDAADRTMAAGGLEQLRPASLAAWWKRSAALKSSRRFLREAELFAVKLDAALTVDDAKLERLLACMRCWDEESWVPPPPPPAPSPTAATGAGCVDGPHGSELFLALPARVHGSIDARNVPGLEPLWEMVVAGGAARAHTT